jgi:hypothetical protein
MHHALAGLCLSHTHWAWQPKLLSKQQLAEHAPVQAMLLPAAVEQQTCHEGGN